MNAPALLELFLSVFFPDSLRLIWSAKASDWKLQATWNLLF